jgi:hypothetical protein
LFGSNWGLVRSAWCALVVGSALAMKFDWVYRFAWHWWVFGVAVVVPSFSTSGPGAVGKCVGDMRSRERAEANGTKGVCECADAPFSGIATMDTSRDLLGINVRGNQMLFESVGTFVVETIEFGC